MNALRRHLPALVLLAHAMVLLALAWQTEWTTDEMNYLKAGIAIRQEGRFDVFVTILHGPLPFLANQLFAWVHDPMDLVAYKFWGRLGLLPFAILCAFFVHRFAKDALGPRLGLLALALHCANPIVLAHGCLMTSDMALAAFYVLAVHVAWRWLQTGTRWAIPALGCALGLALATKYLALFLVPVLGIALGVAALRGWAPGFALRRGGGGARVLDLGLAGLAVAAIATLVLHACYGFGTGGYTVRPAAPAPVNPQDPAAGPLSASFRRLVAWPLVPQLLALLPEPFVRGVDYQKFYSEQGGVTYFLDRILRGGHPLYFVVALGTKLPLAFLALLGVGVAVRRPAWPARLRLLLVLAIGVPVLYLSFFTALQIGVRYLLPVLPLLALVAARGGGWLVGEATTTPARVRRAGFAALLLGLLAFHATEAPRYIQAFNLLAPRPYLLFWDSNLDWRVSWLHDEDEAVLHARHPDAARLPAEGGPRPGRLLVYGMDLARSDPRSVQPAQGAGAVPHRDRIHHWLRHVPPADREGAWYLFEVDPDRLLALAGADARRRVEAAIAMLGQRAPSEILRVLEGNADPDAESVRTVARLLQAGREREPECLASLLRLGRGDRILREPAGVPAALLAHAAFLEGRAHLAISVLESEAGSRRLGLDEALVLASAYAVLGHGSAALAALDRFAPPEGTPERAAFTRVRDRLAEGVRANLDVQGVGQRR
ncbi:MAG: glycosyltransferase family 39 protein [Planctomycetes bacterium]|nr:glycosyltransferase family 39 protein [Planctomycetota bacterium]